MAGTLLRLATVADMPVLEELMKASIREIFPRFYDDRQTASSAEHVGVPDRLLIDDGTYFAVEAGAEIVACGGWSRRERLYMGSIVRDEDSRLLDPATEAAHIRAMFVRGDWTRRGLGREILAASEAAAREQGFTELDLRATLPGVPLYTSYGFVETGRIDVTLPDGVTIECAAMCKPITP